MTYTADRTERLDKFLTRMMPDFSRTRLAALATVGDVKVDGRTAEVFIPGARRFGCTVPARRKRLPTI